MTLTLWEPFSAFDRFDRIVNDLFGPLGTRSSLGVRSAYRPEGAWLPATDLVSDEGAYRLRFDLPGVAKDEITIEVDDGVLTVSGERKNTREAKGDGSVHRRESLRGRFQRSFRLPEDADEDSIDANYKDGVLEIKVDRSEAVSQTKRIPIAQA